MIKSIFNEQVIFKMIFRQFLMNKSDFNYFQLIIVIFDHF